MASAGLIRINRSDKLLGLLALAKEKRALLEDGCQNRALLNYDLNLFLCSNKNVQTKFKNPKGPIRSKYMSLSAKRE